MNIELLGLSGLLTLVFAMALVGFIAGFLRAMWHDWRKAKREGKSIWDV